MGRRRKSRLVWVALWWALLAVAAGEIAHEPPRLARFSGLLPPLRRPADQSGANGV
jgi:hypothetical protein